MADVAPTACIYVLAGTKGAGKSSLAGAMFLAAGVEYFNPDQAARLIRARNPRASQTDANGAAWVEPDINGGARFVWTADLLPHDLAAQVEEMMDAGIAVAKKTLERAHPNPGPLLNP